MSYFTPADAEYIKGSVRKIRAGAFTAGQARALYPLDVVDELNGQVNAELARLFAFIDGCTLEKGKGSE